VRIAVQLCDALECAHALQIVHRDLKPANAMLLAGGRDFVKILDFGLAKSVASDGVTAVTVTGMVLGTPAYMSPEHARGQLCDGRADLYSLGVMLYLLGSGQLPFVSSSPHELLAMHGSEPAPPMTGVPRALAQVVERLLHKEPADRYQTAAEVRDALERALAAGDPVLAEEPEPGAGAPPHANASAAPDASAIPRQAALPTLLARRSRRWVAPAVAGALVAAGVISYLVIARDPPLPQPLPAAQPQPARPPAAAPLPALTVDAGAEAAPDAGLAATPPGASDEAREPAAPRDPRAVPSKKPVKPAKPTKPTRPRPRPTRPAGADRPADPTPAGADRPADPEPAGAARPADPEPAGSGSARSDGLPF
jgi:serine/threonine-protein kinase